jgi:hypothetical protein
MRRPRTSIHNRVDREHGIGRRSSVTPFRGGNYEAEAETAGWKQACVAVSSGIEEVYCVSINTLVDTIEAPPKRSRR